MVACLLLFRVGPAKKQKMIGDIAKRYPHLLAVQYPVVAIASSMRPHTDNIRTGVRFGQAKCRQLCPACLRDEIFLFLLLGAPTINAEAVQTDMHRHRHTQKRIACLEFLTYDSK